MQKHVEIDQILTYSILETGSEWKYNFPNWKGRHGQFGPLHFPKLNGTVRDKFAKVSWKPKCQQCSRKAKFEIMVKYSFDDMLQIVNGVEVEKLIVSGVQCCPHSVCI